MPYLFLTIIKKVKTGMLNLVFAIKFQFELCSDSNCEYQSK